MSDPIDFREIFDRIPSPYMLLDREYRYVAANAAYLAVVQRPWEELDGVYLFEAFPSEGESRAQLEASLSQARDKGEVNELPLIHYAIERPAHLGGGFEDRGTGAVEDRKRVNRHSTRTLADALALREELRPGTRLLVAGGGLLGAEAAATAVGLGAEVVWLVSAAAPLAAVLGAETAALLTGLHREHGVRIHRGTAAAVVRRRGRAAGVRLADGSELAADAVLMAIGSEPATEWLAGSGVSLDAGGGVACDAHCAAGPGVWAAGDAASWPDPRTSRRRRLEQRTNATEQALHAARDLLAGPDGARQAYAPVPYLWTDQYGLRIQAFGSPGTADRFELVDGSPADHRFAAACLHRGRVTGAVGIACARALRQLRAQVAAHAPWQPADPVTRQTADHAPARLS